MEFFNPNKALILVKVFTDPNNYTTEGIKEYFKKMSETFKNDQYSNYIVVQVTPGKNSEIKMGLDIQILFSPFKNYVDFAIEDFEKSIKRANNLLDEDIKNLNISDSAREELKSARRNLRISKLKKISQG